MIKNVNYLPDISVQVIFLFKKQGIYGMIAPFYRFS